MNARRFACTLCGHAQDEHNRIVGCPHCQCAATPHEAMNNGPYEGRILEPTEYLYDWQRPEPPKPVAPEPVVRYEVWRADLDGTPTCIQDPANGARRLEQAQHFADAYTTEEAEVARMEMRPIRKRFVVVKVTTIREVVSR